MSSVAVAILVLLLMFVGAVLKKVAIDEAIRLLENHLGNMILKIYQGLLPPQCRSYYRIALTGLKDDRKASMKAHPDSVMLRIWSTLKFTLPLALRPHAAWKAEDITTLDAVLSILNAPRATLRWTCFTLGLLATGLYTVDLLNTDHHGEPFSTTALTTFDAGVALVGLALAAACLWQQRRAGSGLLWVGIAGTWWASMELCPTATSTVTVTTTVICIGTVILAGVREIAPRDSRPYLTALMALLPILMAARYVEVAIAIGNNDGIYTSVVLIVVAARMIGPAANSYFERPRCTPTINV